MVFSFCGLIEDSNFRYISFTVSDVFALILFLTLPYFYVYKARKQTISTSYKFFLMCTFAYALALFQISQYRYYVKHCQAGVTKVRAIDAQTKEAIPYSVSSPSSKWSMDFSKGRGVSYTIQEGADLWMGLLWMGCEPVSSTVNADGYESKTIIMKPNRIDTVTVELQKIKPAQGESVAGGQN
jgi:hypothetical protein